MSFTVTATDSTRIVEIKADAVIHAIDAIEQIAKAANMTPLQVADGLGRRVQAQMAAGDPD